MKYGLTQAKEKRAGAKTERVKVLVALRGFDAPLAQATDAEPGYAAKRAAHGARKATAKSLQHALLQWLDQQKGLGSYRRVSAPTSFGTFTLEVTQDLLPVLERASEVESVLRVDATPMVLLGGATSAPTTGG